MYVPPALSMSGVGLCSCSAIAPHIFLTQVCNRVQHGVQRSICAARFDTEATALLLQNPAAPLCLILLCSSFFLSCLVRPPPDVRSFCLRMRRKPLQEKKDRCVRREVPASAGLPSRLLRSTRPLARPSAIVPECRPPGPPRSPFEETRRQLTLHAAHEDRQ